MAESQPPLEHEDSIEAQDPNTHKSKKAKNRRPANTAFRQQRLKAWQPILTPKSVLPLFFAIGIIFAPIGGLLLWASSQVQEIIIDYSTCERDATSTPQEMPSHLVTWHFKDTGSVQPQAFWSKETITYTYPYGVSVDNVIRCTLSFDIPSDMGFPVLFYYRLTNFYQNHRRYVKSFQPDQLKGVAVDNNTISKSTCDPLRLDENGKSYYPCGLIANSVFNDTFENPILTPIPNSLDQSTEYIMNNNSGIAWDSDAQLYGKTKYDPASVAVPPNWMKRFPGGYTNATMPDLSNDQAFQVWMRTAGLPTFSKLALRNDTAPMPKGRYMVNVNSNFPVEVYGGTKSIIISTRTVIGGRNPFLGIAYVIVGGICVVLGAIFTVTHLVKPRKLGDHTYLTWNNDQPSTATATGSDTRPGQAA